MATSEVQAGPREQNLCVDVKTPSGEMPKGVYLYFGFQGQKAEGSVKATCVSGLAERLLTLDCSRRDIAIGSEHLFGLSVARRGPLTALHTDNCWIRNRQRKQPLTLC
jgi:hypothetical protein